MNSNPRCYLFGMSDAFLLWSSNQLRLLILGLIQHVWRHQVLLPLNAVSAS